MKKRNVEVKRNSKRASKGVMYTFVIIMFILFIFIISSNVNANKYYGTKNIIVSNGETIWSIANRICKKNDNLDLYSVISDIENLNNIKDSIIYEGQTLKVYSY